MPLKSIFIFFLFIFCFAYVNAQTDQKFEQLEKKINQSKNDSTRAVALNDIAWEYIKVNPEKGIPYSKESVQISKKKGYVKLASSCLNTLANLHESSAQFNLAEEAYKESIFLKKEINDMKGLAIVYSNLAKLKRKLGQHKEGLDLIEKSIHIQDSLKNNYGLALAYTNKGTILNDLGQTDASLSSHKKALYYEEILKDSMGMAYSYINIGGMLYDRGNYREGIDYSLKGLKILEKSKDYSARILALNNLAIAYRKIKNIQIAKQFNKQSINLAHEAKSFQQLAGSLMVKGEILMDQQKFTEALKALFEAKDWEQKYKRKFLETEILGNIGACYYQLKQYDLASKYLNQATRLANEHGMSSVEFRCLMKIASIQLDLEQAQNLDTIFKRSEKLVKQLNSKRLYLEFYKNRIRYFKLIGKEKEQLKDYETYFIYRDSILPEIASNSLSDAAIKYETEKKNATIQLLNKEKKIRSLTLKQQEVILGKRKLWIWFLGILGFLILSSAILGFRLQRKYATKRKELEIKNHLESERQRFSKDIHDDIGSGLSKIRFIAESLTVDESQDKIKQKAHSLQQTAHQLVDNMRDLIWVLQPENSTITNLEVRIREYISDYIEDTSLQAEVLFNLENEHLTLTSELNRSLFSIVKESLQNTLKHANATDFNLQFTQKNNKLNIQITDNGIGFKNEETLSGNGLKNMKLRVQKFGGNIYLESKNGMQINIEIPI